MGLTGAAVGFNNALQQALAERYAQQQAQQQYADHLRQQQFDNEMRQKTFDSNEELKRAQLAATEEARQATAANQRFGQAATLGDQLPEGTRLTEDDPGVGILRTGGRGSLLQPVDERPEVTTGPLLPGDTGATLPKGFIKTASAKQIDTRTDNERQAAAAETQAKREAEAERHNRAMENRPQSNATVTIQTVDAQGNPVTRVVPKAEAIGKDFAKAAPQSLQVEVAHKKDAIGALDQLDQSIDAAKDLIGPGAGRFTSIEQMIGSADPRAQALAAKMQLAKMKVDAGIGGMRAAASPQLLARWDNILSQKVTPEGLKAAVQAMREILGAQSAAPATGGKPSAADLIKKYGG